MYYSWKESTSAVTLTAFETWVLLLCLNAQACGVLRRLICCAWKDGQSLLCESDPVSDDLLSPTLSKQTSSFLTCQASRILYLNQTIPAVCPKAKFTNSALLFPRVSAKLDDISLFQNPICRRRFPLFDHTSSCYSCSTNDGLILTCTLRVSTHDLEVIRSVIPIMS